jgi:hypothetical protein
VHLFNRTTRYAQGNLSTRNQANVKPWPRARFREGRHFMDDKMGFRLLLRLVEGSTTVFQTTAASDGLYWAKPAWFRHFGDRVAGELEMVIDGHFCVAKSGFL